MLRQAHLGSFFHTTPDSPKADREELTLFCRFAQHVASVRKMHLRVSGRDCELIVNQRQLLFSMGWWHYRAISLAQLAPF